MGTSVTEELGVEVVERYFDMKGIKAKRVPFIKGNAVFENYQYTKGDFVVFEDGVKHADEVKTEEANIYGNFFIETWSNKSIRRPGWLYNLTTTRYLYYVFLREQVIYVLDFAKLKQFDLSPYPEVQQTKHVQENDTWGRLVKIRHLRAAGVLVDTIHMNPGNVH